MSTVDDEELLEDTERSVGSKALRRNIEAAIALAGAVRSTLGPKGLDKLLVDGEGRMLVTNDGVTVLETAAVEHPAAKMIISSSSIQDKVARDGTSTTVLLCGELLRNAWVLVTRGVHPATIASGYRMAAKLASESLAEIAKPISADEHYEQATLTSLAGKGDSSLQECLAKLAVQAATLITINEQGGKRSDPTLVKVLANKGGRVADSHLVKGLVLAKSCIHPEMKDKLEGGKILLLDGALERRSPSIDATLKVTNVGMLDAFRAKEREMLRAQVEAIATLGPDVCVVRDGVEDDARQWLSEAGITTYRRVERPDLELLARATGARLVHRPESATEADLGYFNSSREELWSDTTHWILEGAGERGATLVTRGSTEEILEEVERCFADALGVACQLHEEGLLLPGGGATQVALARRLRRAAETIPGREQLAVEAYADALEIIPRVLAENAGLDPIGQLLALVAAQTQDGDWVGLDLRSGDIADMDERGIREPIRIARQAILGATDSAVAILRIDDVLWAQEGPSIPDGVMP